MANDDVARKRAEMGAVYAEIGRQFDADMARVWRGEPLPPGDRGASAWLPTVEPNEPFFGVERTVSARRFDRPVEPEPPRSLWQRLRGAWDGMVAGWRGEAGWDE